MTRSAIHVAVSFLVLLAFQKHALGFQATDPRQASGKNGVVATGCQLAADAGLGILQADGNAFDAAVSTMLVQTVVEAHLFCFGSEVPIIVYDKDRDVVEVIVGLGAAPQLATPKWFQDNRQGVIQGRHDIANCVVPGYLDAMLVLLERYGTKTFQQCAAPMLQELEKRANTPVDSIGAKTRGRLTAEGWVQHHQNFHRLIQRLVKSEADAGPDRLAGLKAVREYFYRGPIAKEIDRWSRKEGGLIRYRDFANHHTRIESPRSVRFRDVTIHKCDVWTQGPFLLQTMNLLADHELEKLVHGSTDHIHLVTEAMKLGFADRDAYYGDPTFVEVPIEKLLSDAYTEIRRPLIKMDYASQVQQVGDPYKMHALSNVAPKDYQVVSGFSEDTSNCVIADKLGNVVAATPSGWGGVPAGDTGVQMGSRLIGLNVWENHPSMVQPGKRPRITLTPTLVMQSGKPVFAVSVAGGDRQDQASIQILLNRFVFGMTPAKSVQTPRFSTAHHINWFGHSKAKLGTVTVPKQTSQETIQSLEQRGHKVGSGRTAGAAVVVSIDQQTGEMKAATDRGKVAVGW